MIVAEDQRRVRRAVLRRSMHGVVETLPRPASTSSSSSLAPAHDGCGLEHYVAGGHLDGVMLIARRKGRSARRHVEPARCAVVYTGRPFKVTDCTFVDADNAGGATQAVRHLHVQAPPHRHGQRHPDDALGDRPPARLQERARERRSRRRSPTRRRQRLHRGGGFKATANAARPRRRSTPSSRVRRHRRRRVASPQARRR